MKIAAEEPYETSAVFLVREKKDREFHFLCPFP